MLTEEEKKKKEEVDKLKMEVAKELGLEDKIAQFGWKGLSAKETGRIGGIMNTRNRKKRVDNNN